MGVGIFGGIARQIFKIHIGVPTSSSHLKREIEEEPDLRIFVLVKKLDSVLESQIRLQLEGVSICGVCVNPTLAVVRILLNTCIRPNDIQIAEDVHDFFRSQDITQNELLVSIVLHDE